MIRRIKKRFDIQVTAANETFTKSFELDKSIVCVKGLLFTSNMEDFLYFRGSQRIEINAREYFPEGYETKLLMNGINVAPNFRFYRLGRIKPGNGIVKVEFKDEDDGRTTFSAYRVSLYLDLEMEDSE